jgi:hypothetical protein
LGGKLTPKQLERVRWLVWEPLRRSPKYQATYGELVTNFNQDTLLSFCKEWDISIPIDPRVSFDDLIHQLNHTKKLLLPIRPSSLDGQKKPKPPPKVRKIIRYIFNFSPGDSSGRLRPEIWERRFQIYDLHKDRGWDFVTIGHHLGISRRRANTNYQEAWEAIHARQEYATIRVRRQEEEIDISSVPCAGGDDCPYVVEGVPRCRPRCPDDCLHIPGSKECINCEYNTAELCPEAARYRDQDKETSLKYSGQPSIKQAERFIAKQADTGRRIPKLSDEESDEGGEVAFVSVLVGQIDKSESGTAFNKLIERKCLKQFRKAEGYELCGYKAGHERCSRCNQQLEIIFRSAELNKWPIEPGRLNKETKFEIGGIPWDAYVEGFTHAPVPGVPGEIIPKECYLAWRFQRIFEQVEFEHKRKLPRSKELNWQDEYLQKHGARPWFPKYTWNGKKTTWTIIRAKNYGPKWWWPTYYWPRAPVVPCADCGDECQNGEFPCAMLSQWVNSKPFKLEKRKKPDPKGKRYDGLMSEFTMASSRPTFAEYLSSLVDESLRHNKEIDAIIEEARKTAPHLADLTVDAERRKIRQLFRIPITVDRENLGTSDEYGSLPSSESLYFLYLKEKKIESCEPQWKCPMCGKTEITMIEFIPTEDIRCENICCSEEFVPLELLCSACGMVSSNRYGWFMGERKRPLPWWIWDIYDGSQTWQGAWLKIVNPTFHLIEPRKHYNPIFIIQEEMPLARHLVGISRGG